MEMPYLQHYGCYKFYLVLNPPNIKAESPCVVIKENPLPRMPEVMLQKNNMICSLVCIPLF